MADASWILERAVEEHVTADGRSLAAVCLLFSGGNDSTVLAHMFRDRATHAIHANTTIGIEATRAFVRDTCAGWGLPLIEKTPPHEADRYRARPRRGFPTRTAEMCQRLKERGLRRRDGTRHRSRRERVVFLAGRRRDEVARRRGVPESGRDGSVVWVSPLVDWTKAD
jgi:3'-phosphoadenosine 5'-phosphosulfate sulfotransferase (PAPS reductase)/FAD synthetase